MSAFKCPTCGAVSHHPVDLIVGWCGRCESFTGRSLEQVAEIADESERVGDRALAAAIRRRLA